MLVAYRVFLSPSSVKYSVLETLYALSLAVLNRLLHSNNMDPSRWHFWQMTSSQYQDAQKLAFPIFFRTIKIGGEGQMYY